MLSKLKHASALIYISYFFVYSFIGWTLETIYAYFKYGYFVNRGFLYGPLCPIYGFGVVILIALLKPYKNNILIFFLGSSLVLTILEFLTGAALFLIFHSRWWDYTGIDYNFYGFICFGTSILWGLLSVIFMHSIHPFVDIIISRIINKAAIKLIYFFLVLTICDFFLSLGTVLYY